MRSADALRCCQFVELVTGYLENALPLPERARCEAHLARCGSCATYLEQTQQTVRWLGRLGADAVAPSARQDLLGVFRAWQRGAV